jgi:hypothetical protein
MENQTTIGRGTVEQLPSCAHAQRGVEVERRCPASEAALKALASDPALHAGADDVISPHAALHAPHQRAHA